MPAAARCSTSARVVDRPHAVPDPVGEVVLEGLPDVAGPGPLAGVRDRTEAGRLRPAEQGTERGDLAPLAPSGVQRDHAAARVLQRHLQRALRQLGPGVAHEVGSESGRHPELAPASLEAVQHGLDRAEPIVAETRGMVAGREHDLDVADAVARLVFAELVRQPAEVLGGGEQGAHRRVLPDEVVDAGEPPAPAREAGRHRRAPPLGELANGLDPHRSLQMDMELRFRESREVAHPAHGSAGGHRRRIPKGTATSGR